MSRIRIVSNPYEQTLRFLIEQPDSGEFREVDAVNYFGSSLISEALSFAFFPFKVKEIVDTIICEFKTDEGPVHIEFEGADDEYREIEAICRDEYYLDKVILSRTARKIANARDILPTIKTIFGKLDALAADTAAPTDGSATLDANRRKFTDAVNDLIPICVIGNYSAGKSTFINALIGYEVLPSSDEPTTAKVYKLIQAETMDRAMLKMNFRGTDVVLAFTADSYSVVSGNDTDIAHRITEAFRTLTFLRIPTMLNKALETINDYVNKISADAVSDIIEVTLPFDEDGLWGRINSRFVIFDTPGSNSASFDHAAVLERAMANMADGLPIFVSEKDALDSNDNELLFSRIHEMQALDDRFTMIVVNKADRCSLPTGGFSENDTARLLDQAIPRNLYAYGIYFVASIMGLGAKNDESFIYDQNDEIFEDQRPKYDDPTNKRYKQLYRYNILPEQIKRSQSAECENYGNRIYANSGLMSVEQAIETFAVKYAAYNKYTRAEKFLRAIIAEITERTDTAKQTFEAGARIDSETLEKQKTDLIEALKTKDLLECRVILDRYDNFMKVSAEECDTEITEEYLHALAVRTGLQHSETQGVKALEANVETAKTTVSETKKTRRDTLWSHLRKGEFREALRDRGADTVQVTAAKQRSDYARQTLSETRDNVDREVSEELLQYAVDAFDEKRTEMVHTLVERSTRFWNVNLEVLKGALSELVSGFEDLSAERREWLSHLIMNHAAIAEDNRAEAIFRSADFRYHFLHGERLNLKKLGKRYNEEIIAERDRTRHDIMTIHRENFETWNEHLMDELTKNIIEYNDKLRTLNDHIAETHTLIEALSGKLSILESTLGEVENMSRWTDTESEGK